MNQRVLIIIPAFNEENTIASVLLSLEQVVPDSDRVVVNDGSTDATAEIVRQLGEKQLLLPCNLGYGLALQTGIKYALIKGYDIIVSFDSDGQHRAEDVSPLVEVLITKDADLVIGSRFFGGNLYSGHLSRRLGQILFSYLTQLLIGRRIYDTTSGLKALRAPAFKAMAHGSFLDFHTETIVRLGLLGFKIVEVPVKMQERSYGRSMYSFINVFIYPMKTLLLTIIAAVDAILARRLG